MWRKSRKQCTLSISHLDFIELLGCLSSGLQIWIFQSLFFQIVVNAKLWLILVNLTLGTVEATCPQLHSMRLGICSWSNLHTGGRSQGGQKWQCPSNIGDLYSDLWVLLLITEVQIGWWQLILHLLPLLWAPPTQAEVISRVIKGPTFFSPHVDFSLFSTFGS